MALEGWGAYDIAVNLAEVLPTCSSCTVLPFAMVPLRRLPCATRRGVYAPDGRPDI